MEWHDEKRIELYPDELQNLLVEPKEEVASYSTKYINLGMDRFGRLVQMDTHHPLRILILGITGSGKTWLKKVIHDRAKEAGYACADLTDVKNEAWIGGIEPIQKRFEKKLLPGEKRKKMRIVSFRLTFFWRKDKGKCPQGNHWISLNPAEMKKVDFMTILNVRSMTPPQQNVMNIVFDRMEKTFEKNPEDFTFQWLFDAIEQVPGIQSNQIEPLHRRLYPLKSSNVYMPDYDVNIIPLIQRGWTPAFNLSEFEEFFGSDFNPPPVAVSLLLRKIITARRKKLIPPVWVFVDEASRFVPPDRDLCSRRDIQESVDVDTAYGVNYVFATQSIEKLPDVVVKQCRYIFLPYNTDTHVLKEVLKLFGILPNLQSAYKEAARYKRQMKQFDWMMIDRNEQTVVIFNPAAPLSAIMEREQ